MGFITGPISQAMANITNKEIADLTNKANLLATNQTNKYNLAIGREYNNMQAAIANAANDINYKMFNEQNQWNLDRRNEEWAYNDPSAQMQRLIQAGINPIYGMGGGAAGQAQQLTSAPAPEAVVPDQYAPTMQAPHFDSYSVAPIAFGDNNLSDLSAQILAYRNQRLAEKKFGLEASKTEADIAHTEAETVKIKEETKNQSFINSINDKTYDIQVGQIQSNYDKTRKEIDSMDKDTELKDAKIRESEAYRGQIEAATTKILNETLSHVEYLTQLWYGLRSQRMQAEAAKTSAAAAQTSANAAQTSANAAMLNAGTNAATLAFNRQKAIDEYKSKTFAQLLDIFDKTKKTYQSTLNMLVFKRQVEGVEHQDEHFGEIMSTFSSLLQSACEKYAENPTVEGQKCVNEIQSYINALQFPNLPLTETPNQSPSVINNESEKW